ncbi:GNAT family N-acetyltransferase [Desulfoluna spongiiphila]|uniref:Acetyltransferase (GNAT) domain-containing protein n=1 Tax=Desulfoluna spongiiphila TaxID=419481 RepID=A0A1G5DW13_9BACT|nr:GNAT family N-acetyltransferase [Desulfoluna spongiiphila]SCY18939.1 Acetyltransferase (GNAT) domain-containing protein [Desulfoluna spongiiphila]
MVEIVPYENCYLSGIVDMILSIQRDEFQIDITLDDQPDLLDIPAFYQKGSGNFWMALKGSEVIGTVSLLDIGGGKAALRKMFVKQSFRGAQRGVAGCLLKTLLTWSASIGISDVYLGTTTAFLAAHRFYEKNGFLEILETELPPSFPKMSVDTKFYRQMIKPSYVLPKRADLEGKK